MIVTLESSVLDTPTYKVTLPFRDVRFTVLIILVEANFGAVCGIAPIPPPVAGGTPVPFDAENENISSPKREPVSRVVSSLGGVEVMFSLRGDEGP